MQLLQNKEIAIIGGGPGGLTLARLLQLKGARVQVYERDANKNVRVQGAPLDMHKESGWKALFKANLIDDFNQNIRFGADKKIIVNRKAEVLFSDHALTKQDKIPAKPEIDRGALRTLLLEHLHPETVVWDRHFISMEANKAGWQLHFKNSPSAYADLVIAADGAHSKVRSYVTPIKAFYTGITMLEINIQDAEKTTPLIYNLLHGGKIMAFGDSRCILGGQKGNKDLGFYASFKASESWLLDNGLDLNNPSQVLKWFNDNYQGWDAIWNELFKKSKTPFIPRPIYCMPLNQRWTTLPNATLIGDAAHVMPPFAGEGANMAMLDALELSEYLTGSYKSLAEAIYNYEKSMLPRAAKAMQRSLENGEKMHAPDTLQTFLMELAK